MKRDDHHDGAAAAAAAAAAVIVEGIIIRLHDARRHNSIPRQPHLLFRLPAAPHPSVRPSVCLPVRPSELQ